MNSLVKYLRRKLNTRFGKPVRRQVEQRVFHNHWPTSVKVRLDVSWSIRTRFRFLEPSTHISWGEGEALLKNVWSEINA